MKSSHQMRSLTTPTQETMLGYRAPFHKYITSGMESPNQRVSYWS